VQLIQYWGDEKYYMGNLSCKLCGQITFDNKHINQRTGKKIPLDPETNEPHEVILQLYK
jgi:hypothetical protein